MLSGRKTATTNVKQAILKTQSLIRDVQEEQNSMQGQIVIELQGWNDAELELKCSTSQEVILRNQLESLQKQCQADTTTLQHIKAQHLELHDSFCSDVTRFMTSHDLLSYTSHQRDVTMHNAIQQLTLKKQQLERKLSVYSQQQVKVDALQSKVDKVTTQIDVNTEELDGVERHIEGERIIIKKLEEQKQNVSDVPHTSQDYLRLRAELGRCKEETLEDYCAALQCELQELQQKLWQKNIRVKQPPKPPMPKVAVGPPALAGVQQRFTAYGHSVPDPASSRPKSE